MPIAARRRPGRTSPRVEALEPRNLLSAAGTLDPSFGGGLGYVTFPVSSTTRQAAGNFANVSGVAVQPDGKILIAGTVSVGNGDPLHPSGVVSFVLERLNPNGTTDTTFGTNGLFTTTVSVDGNGQAGAVLIQPNGDIIEVGSADLVLGGTATGAQAFVAIRLLPNGALDTSFGTGGLASYPPGTFGAAGNLTSVASAALQPNGQVVLVGQGTPANSTTIDMTAVRLNANGSLDTSFGTAGTVNVPIAINGTATATYAVGLAIQSTGQVVMVGSAGLVGEGVAVRLNPDGTRDLTFGGTGRVLIPPPPGSPTGTPLTITNLAQRAGGKLLLSGYTTTPGTAKTTPELIGLNADGTFDPSFGRSGYVAAPLGGSIAIQPDGKIVVAGQVPIPQVSPGLSNDPRTEFASLRLNPDGSVDPTFGTPSTPGLAAYSFGSSNVLSTPAAVAIQPADGNIVLVGTARLNTYPALIPPFAVARVLATASTGPGALPPPPTPPASFDGSGLTNYSVYLPTSGDFAIRSSNGLGDQFLQFGSPGAGQTIPATADYLGVGQDQVAVYLTNGGVYAIQAIPGISPGLFLQFGIPGVGQTVPVPADYEGTGHADVAVFLTASATYAIIPSDGTPAHQVQLGTPGLGQSIPAPADYFGTGRADLAVYLAASGTFAIKDPTGKTPGVEAQFGLPGVGKSIPVPGDYDGSGHVELAVYIPTQGAFFYRPAKGGPDVEVRMGAPNSGLIPAVGDYDGAGHDEFALYDPVKSSFEFAPARGGPDEITQFGTPGGSIPLATPAGDLPQFTGSKPGPAPGSAPGSGGNAIRPDSVPPGSSTPASTNAITATKSSAVPAGPTLASVRVARSLINQGVDDPSNKRFD